jgi:hypothetical protein
MMGDREMNGEVTIELMAPDRLKRTDQMGIPGGPTVERVAAINGADFWEDSTNRGGGGFFARFGGPGGPGGPGGQGPTDADRERWKQMQQRRLQSELRRYMLLWLMRTDAPTSYAGVAEATDGKADVIEIKPEGARPMRLFLDQQTHLPLMLTYQGIMPRFFIQRRERPARPGGEGSSDGRPSSGRTPPAGQGQSPPPSDEMRRAMAEPPQEVTFEVRLSDYRSVGGVMLPHTMTESVDGKPREEWTITQYKVNPKLKPETFVKK